MKLHADSTQGLNRISAYGPGFFVVNERRYDHGIAMSCDGDVRPWTPRDPGDLDAAALAIAAELEADILLVGTGARQHFPPADALSELRAAGTGVEIMSTDAACRTYNVLASESRRVAALLIVIGA